MMLAVFCLFALVAGPIFAQSDVNQQLATLQSKVDSLESQISNMRKKVAFSVRTNPGYGNWLNIAQNAAIHFPNVLTNIGDGYSTLNGQFTAPYSGVYMFFYTMRSRWGHQGLHVGIFKNYNLLAMASGDGQQALTGIKGVAMAITHVNAGDKVYCRRYEGPGTDIEDGWFTTFSGVLITPD